MDSVYANQDVIDYAWVINNPQISTQQKFVSYPCYMSSLDH